MRPRAPSQATELPRCVAAGRDGSCPIGCSKEPNGGARPKQLQLPARAKGNRWRLLVVEPLLGVLAGRGPALSSAGRRKKVIPAGGPNPLNRELRLPCL